MTQRKFIIFFVSVVFLFLQARPACGQQTGLPILSDIQCENLKKQAQITVSTDIHTDFIFYELDEPVSIVIDPLGDAYTNLQKKINYKEGIIKSITLVAVGETTPQGYYTVDSIIIELREPKEYNYIQENANLILSIGKPAKEEVVLPEVIKEEQIPKEERLKEQMPKVEKSKVEKPKPPSPVVPKPPKIEVPARIIYPQKAKTITPGQILTLEDCIEIAAQNSLAIQVAQEDVRLAKLKIRDARRAIFPNVTAKATLTTGEVFTVGFDEKSYGVSIEQPIYYGGRLMNALKQARVNLDIAKKKLNKQKADLAYKVAESYFNLVTQNNNIGVQQDLVAYAKDALKVAQRRFDAGLSTKQEILNVKSQHDQSVFQLETVKREQTLANLALQQAMNIEKETPLTVKSDLKYKKKNINIDDCLQLAFVNRLELKINELLVKFNLLEKKLAKGKDDFKIDLSGFMGKSGSAFETETLTLTDDWNVGLKVSKPLLGNTASYSFTKEETSRKVGWKDRTETTTNSFEFSILNALQNKTEFQQANVNYRKAIADLFDARQSIFYEVKESYFNFQKANLQLENSNNRVEFRKEEFKIVTAQAELNEALTSQVLDSRLKLAEEQVSYNQALSNYHLAIEKINKAVGVSGYYK